MISPFVRAADVDGLCVVIDLATSAVYVLDEDASIIWAALHRAGGFVDAAKDDLGRAGGSSRRVLHMVDEFVANWESRGFIGPPSVPQTHPMRSPRPPRRAHPTVLLTARAWLSMLRTDFMLRRHEFAAVYERLGRDVEPSTADPAYVELAQAAFLRAENLYWRRCAPNDCLPRTLALYGYLRQLGVAAVHRIGARRFPRLHCHAWVEFDGAPILDNPDRVGQYCPIATM